MDNREVKTCQGERRLVGVNGFYVQRRRNVGVESCVIGEIANIAPSSVFLSFTSMAEKFGSRLNTQIYEL